MLRAERHLAGLLKPLPAFFASSSLSLRAVDNWQRLHSLSGVLIIIRWRSIIIGNPIVRDLDYTAVLIYDSFLIDILLHS